MGRIDAPGGEESQSQETAATHKPWRGLFITFLILLFLYPLSLGPFSYLEIRGVLPSDVAESVYRTIYKPLWNYSRSESPFAKTYDRYLQWWIQKALTEQMNKVILR